MENSRAFARDLRGMRVLVAEDRSLIASKVVQILHRNGCVPVEPVPTLGAGLDLMQRDGIAIDAAILDIDLRGQPVYPLAEALQARGVPLLFLTGYGGIVIPPPWSGILRVEKPFDEATLIGTLRIAIAGPSVRRDAPDWSAGVEPSQLVRQAWNVIRSSRDLITEGRIMIERGGLKQRR